MINDHEECHTCYLCKFFFETEQSLKYHNEFTHKEFCELTEREKEDILQDNTNVTKQHQKHKKHRKSKKVKKKLDGVGPVDNRPSTD